MKLLRVIIARFDGLNVADWNDAFLSHDKFTMNRIRVRGNGTWLEVFIGCEEALLTLPQIDDQGNLVPPTEVARALEGALESVVDSIAVSTRTHRSLRSPVPSVVFLAETDEERTWLGAKKGIARQPRSVPATRPRVPIEKMQEIRMDRPDGIALLAEALAHPHATGRFHEFFRLFERAFRTDCERLGAPLGTLLSGANMGYTFGEVETWIKMRGPITHADRRNTFLLERDASPVIHRMEQAAFDVLLNKNY